MIDIQNWPGIKKNILWHFPRGTHFSSNRSYNIQKWTGFFWKAYLRKYVKTKLKHKQEICRRWKRGQATWIECRDIVRVCINTMRMAKANLELNLANDVENNKKNFFKYINNKRKISKMCACYWMGQGPWRQRTQKRQRYWKPFLFQSSLPKPDFWKTIRFSLGWGGWV